MLKQDVGILVVDDMATLRELMQKTLHDLGFPNVTQAADVKEAKSLLQGYADSGLPFGLILSDINMPSESGLDLLKWIRAQATYKTTPVIMVSAMGDIEHVQSAVVLGANNFIVKPFTPDSVKTKLAKL